MKAIRPGWTSRIWIALAACLIAMPSAAKILWGFERDAIDLATDIVEVVEDADRPGAYRVVSVWRGGLEPGHVFEPGTFRFDLHFIRWDLRHWPMADEPPELLEPASVVLFLRDAREVGDARLDRLKAGEPRPRWLPANRRWLGSHALPALYLKDGRAYGLHQAWGNPGPLVPVYHSSATKWQRRVKAYDDLAGWLEDAEDNRSPDELAEVYADALDEGFHGLLDRAREALKAQGAAATGPIRKNLLPRFGAIGGRTNDWAFRGHRPQVYELLVEIDRDAAQPALRLQAEYSMYHFRQVLKTDLEPWLNFSVFALNNRQEYAILATVLLHLDPHGDEKTLEHIRAIRELWRDERLHVKEAQRFMNLDVVQLCDDLLKAAEAPPGN